MSSLDRSTSRKRPPGPNSLTMETVAAAVVKLGVPRVAAVTVVGERIVAAVATIMVLVVCIGCPRKPKIEINDKNLP